MQTRSQSKKTALHYAAMQGHRGVVQALLAHGVDTTLTDEVCGAHMKKYESELGSEGKKMKCN